MTLRGEVVRTDCLHFRGDVPCKPHKAFGVHCDGCTHVVPREGRILIIKLGATGDVVRTTVLLPALREAYPKHEIWWLTLSPQIVPSSVHKRLPYTLESIQAIESIEFDVVINLDKDLHACALASRVKSPSKHGFVLSDGLPAPANAAAESKFLTGIFDDANKSNTKSYPHEVLELCGFEYKHQEYEIDAPAEAPVSAPEGKHIVGLNTGCGDRWVAREWPLQHWEELIKRLQSAGYGVMLLGGPAEDERNRQLQQKTGAAYGGTFPLTQFVGIVNSCDVVVTTVTLGLHIAIALRKQVVLMNNIFNKHEFELYGRGVLIEPPVPCTCFFQNQCTNTDYCCMEKLTPETIFNAVVDRFPHE